MRCCGKCRTPYNCGNKACTCHTKDGANRANAIEWAAHYQEPPQQARYWIDQTIDARAAQARYQRRHPGGPRG